MALPPVPALAHMPSWNVLRWPLPFLMGCSPQLSWQTCQCRHPKLNEVETMGQATRLQAQPGAGNKRASVHSRSAQQLRWRLGIAVGSAAASSRRPAPRNEYHITRCRAVPPALCILQSAGTLLEYVMMISTKAGLSTALASHTMPAGGLPQLQQWQLQPRHRI